MAISFLQHLGKLLDKTTDIIPVCQYDHQSQYSLAFDKDDPPCDIVVSSATSQDKGFPIRDSACSTPIVYQWECGAIWDRVEKLDFVLIPGTVSAVSIASVLAPPSSIMELGRDCGVQAV